MSTEPMTEPGRQLSVLLVEDDPGDVLIAREAMAAGQLSTTLAVVSDGVEAMKYLRRQNGFADAVRPDLILLDLNLPRKNGRELLVEIKSTPNLRRIPVMILSTSRSEADIAFSYDNHANCYIQKPMEFDSYFDVVRSIERFWCGVASLPGHAAAQRAAS
jgi:chemotaxis family two-component system response regulator Rcp1